jgi:hypothetical protein
MLAEHAGARKMLVRQLLGIGLAISLSGSTLLSREAIATPKPSSLRPKPQGR